MKKRIKQFDPHASLAGFIARMEAVTGHRVDGDPSAACAAILKQVRDAFSEFERSVITLHESGQTAAIEIIVGDIVRCMRRAIRLAEEHGAPYAPQTVDMGRKPSSGAADQLIGSQCSDAIDGEGQE